MKKTVLTSTVNGNIITAIGHGPYLYEDGTSPEGNIRPCPKCNQLPTKEGHDACIPNLPGVAFACCGHGLGWPGGIYTKDIHGVCRDFKSIEEMIEFHTEAE